MYSAIIYIYFFQKVFDKSRFIIPQICAKNSEWRGYMLLEKIRIKDHYAIDYVLMRMSFDPLNMVNLEERVVKLPYRNEKINKVVTVQISKEDGELIFTIEADVEEDKEQIVTFVQDIFQLQEDLEKVQLHFAQTNLTTLFKQYPFTPVVKEVGLYPCLIKTIIHQQLNLTFSHILTERFVHTYGKQIDGVWFYPTPEDVAVLSYEDLRALQFSTRKAEYIIDTSRAIAEGKLDLNQLKEESDEAIIRELITYRGIGKWTAQNWLLFGLGRKNLFPMADIGIQNALKKYLQLEKKPTIEQMVTFSKDWEPYLTYATMTLWRSIETS